MNAIDPIFSLLLIPPILAIVAAIVFVRRTRPNRTRTAWLVVLIVASGLLASVVLFVGFLILYYASGGH